MLSAVAYTTRRADGNYRIDVLTVRTLLSRYVNAAQG